MFFEMCKNGVFSLFIYLLLGIKPILLPYKMLSLPCKMQPFIQPACPFIGIFNLLFLYSLFLFHYRNCYLLLSSCFTIKTPQHFSSTSPHLYSIYNKGMKNRNKTLLHPTKHNTLITNNNALTLQNLLFCIPKAQVLHGKSGCFASQNLRFWKTKEKPSIFCKYNSYYQQRFFKEIKAFTQKRMLKPSQRAEPIPPRFARLLLRGTEKGSKMGGLNRGNRDKNTQKERTERRMALQTTSSDC